MPANVSYGSIEKKLKSLGYNPHFHPENAELIKNLLDDLIKVSEAYQNIKKAPLSQFSPDKLCFTSSDTKLIEILLERENDGLHDEIVALKTYIDKKELSFKFQTKTLEDKIFDLQKMMEMKQGYLETVKQENHRLKLKLKEFVVDNFSAKKVKTIDGRTDYGNSVHELIAALDRADSNSRTIEKLEEDKLELEKRLREADLRAIYDKEKYKVDNGAHTLKDEEILRLKLKLAVFDQYRQDFKQLVSIREGYERKLSDLQQQYNILLKGMGHRSLADNSNYNHTSAVLKEIEQRLEETKNRYAAVVKQNEDLMFEMSKLRQAGEESSKLKVNIQILLEVS